MAPNNDETVAVAAAAAAQAAQAAAQAASAAVEAAKIGSRAIEMAASAQAGISAHEKVCTERQAQLLRNQDAAATERTRMHDANQSSVRTIHNRMWALMVLALAGSIGTIMTVLMSKGHP